MSELESYAKAIAKKLKPAMDRADEPKTQRDIYGVAQVSSSGAGVLMDGASSAVRCHFGVNCLNGDRVVCHIVNHSVYVIANLTNPNLSTAEAVTHAKSNPNSVVVQNVVLSDSTLQDVALHGFYATDGTIAHTFIKGSDIDGSTFANGSISGTAIDSSTFSDGQISGTKINASTFTDGQISGTKINASTFTDGQISGTKIDASTFTDGQISGAKIDASTIADGTISGTAIDTSTFTDGSISGSVIDSSTLTNIPFAEIDVVDANSITAQDFTSTIGYIGALESDNINASDIIADHATISSLGVTYATINELHSGYAEIDLANVNNAWITNGVIANEAVADSQIASVSANKLTAGTIDAAKINVANLNAKNLIVEKINGQPVLGGLELVSPSSSGYSSKNPSTEGWYEMVNGSFVLSSDTEVDDSNAYYRSGTATRLYDQDYIDGLESDLNDRIDGAIETFTADAVPTLSNYPASDWTSSDYASHVGDVCYVLNPQAQANGYCYRFAYDTTNEVYEWVLIKDSDVTAALQRLVDAEGDISGLQSFQTSTQTWITNTDTEIGSLQSAQTSLTTRVTNAENALETKVDTTTFNSVSNTVDSHTQTIQSMSTTVQTASTNASNALTAANTAANAAAANAASITTLSNNYNTLVDTVDEHTQKVGEFTAQIYGYYALSTTAAGTAAKTATIDPAVDNWSLVDGVSVAVKFENANTASTPTLSVNGTTATPIKNASGEALVASEYQWSAGDLKVFTYDEENEYWILTDGSAMQRLSSAESMIRQNSEGITLRVTKTEFDASSATLSDLENYVRGYEYVLTEDTVAKADVDYYTVVYTQVDNLSAGDPVEGLYVLSGGSYVLTSDTVAQAGTTYYSVSYEPFAVTVGSTSVVGKYITQPLSGNIAAQFDDMQSNWKAKANEQDETIRGLTTQVSTIEQSASEISSKVTTLESGFGTYFKQDGDSFSFVFKSAIDENKEALELLNQYITIKGSTMTLGSSDHPVCAQLSERGLSFYPVKDKEPDTGNPIASLVVEGTGASAQGVLVIHRAVIVNELRLGDWVWMPRPNGNLTLKWIGV